jgi:hypothetical protein
MSKQKKSHEKDIGWPQALEVAQDKLAEGRAFVAKMKAAEKTIERKIASGEPWPGRGVFGQKG